MTLDMARSQHPVQSDRLRIALKYGRLGLAVFPCHSIANKACSCGNPKCKSSGKHPRTANGVNDASTDEAQIREWWRESIDANIGVATGRSKIYVIDDDTAKHGFDSIRRLEDEGFVFPSTVTATTGSGGRHLIFKRPEIGTKAVVNVLGKLGLPGLDVRCGNSYILACPSNHISGGIYKWDDGVRPETFWERIADVPEWWLNKVGEAENHLFRDGTADSYGPSRLSFAVQSEHLTDGEKHSTMVKVICSLIARNFTYDDVKTMALAFFKMYSSTPVPDENIVAIANDCWRRYANLRHPRQSMMDFEAPLFHREAIAVSQDTFAMQKAAIDTLKAFVWSQDPPRLYLRGGSLVHLRQDENARIEALELDAASLDNYLIAAAEFVRFGKDSEPKPAPVPSGLAKRILSLPTFSDFPVLRGIIDTPQVGEIGELVLEPGYDQASGWLFLPSKEVGHAVRNLGEPTLEKAKAAVSAIFGIFADVSWADAESKTNALAAVITPIVMSYIGETVPWIVIDAPSQGSGKTTLARCIAGFTDKAVGVTAFDSDEYQMTNKILGALVGGRRTFIFDNLVGRIKSASLSQLITSEVFEGRRLGGNEIVRLRNNMMILATANNANIDLDLVSRALYIRLDTGLAQNRERQYTAENPWMIVSKEHSRCVSHLLEIIRWWIKIGRPESTSKQTRFRRWEAIVGGILECVEVEGLANNACLLDRIDEHELALGDFIRLWWEAKGDGNVAASDLRVIGFGAGFSSEGGPLDAYFAKDLATEKAKVTALGCLLQKRRDMVFDLGDVQVKISHLESHGAAVRNCWRLVEVPQRS